MNTLKKMAPQAALCAMALGLALVGASALNGHKARQHREAENMARLPVLYFHVAKNSNTPEECISGRAGHDRGCQG